MESSLNPLDGLTYNFRGLRLGLHTGKLLFWGLTRLLLGLVILLVLSGLILSSQREMVELIWIKPQSPWLVWLWYLVSWFISLLLLLIAAFTSFLLSQLLFSALIMDHMSRVTESLIQGYVTEPEKASSLTIFFYLLKQEIPRAFIPMVASLLVLILGWVTPFGPALTLLASALAAISLAWDNTDLVPARRFLPFKDRWQLLRKNLLFHLGFGLPFLIPVLNLLFLSFAPVGATLYYLETHGTRQEPDSGPLSNLPRRKNDG
jgi:CysZ protein